MKQKLDNLCRQTTYKNDSQKSGGLYLDSETTSQHIINCASGLFHHRQLYFQIIFLIFFNFKSYSQPTRFFPISFAFNFYENGQRVNSNWLNYETTREGVKISDTLIVLNTTIPSFPVIHLTKLIGNDTMYNANYPIFPLSAINNINSIGDIYSEMEIYFDKPGYVYLDSLYFESGLFRLVPIIGDSIFAWNNQKFYKCRLVKNPKSDSIMISNLHRSIVTKADGELYSAKTSANNRSAIYDAKLYYQKAIKFIPTDEYSKRQITIVDSLIILYKEEAYNISIYWGDSLYKEKLYPEALHNYKSASARKSDRQYPKSQIKIIESLIKGNEKKLYYETIQKADSLIKEKEYEMAWRMYDLNVEGYLQYFTDKEYIQKQFDKCEKRRQFINFLRYGDESFNQKSFVSAKSWYSRALELFPNEVYPKEQVKKCD